MYEWFKLDRRIMNIQPLLIEIGTEEMPAGVAPRMGEALRDAIHRLFTDANVNTNELKLGVTPRRLLIYAAHCPAMQADREETIWGPPEQVAFVDGKPTRAAEGFAKKSGLPLDVFDLADKSDGKGCYMHTVKTIKGHKVTDLLAASMPDILRKLPSPKTMCWQDGQTRHDTFIRPIRWIVARLGDTTIPFSFADVEAGLISHGHRVHGSSGEIDVHDPFGWLEQQHVVADWRTRRNCIEEALDEAASDAGVAWIEDESLLDEVTDLTEWPRVITGRYDKAFLRLPAEVGRIELKHHQRCFATTGRDGDMSNVFLAVANLVSRKPEVVAHGNERVVNARLADAAFYFDRDPTESLEVRIEKLSEVVFQDGLGMVGDQVRRLRGFVLDNAEQLGVDANGAQRAAYLCKSDLTTGMVGEFPELQGYMGGIYAHMDGEDDAVASAIAEHYGPAGARDDLPQSAMARAIGIAERADKLLGYFHLGRIPTARTDPFGLRRASIGLIRLLMDVTSPVDMTLPRVLVESAKQWNQQRVTVTITEDTRKRTSAFIVERLIGMAGHLSVSRKALDAALAASTERSLYVHLEVARLLSHFADAETGKAVAAAHRRIANILKKTEVDEREVDMALFAEDAEIVLFETLRKVEDTFPDEPEGQLKMLATLRDPVDVFFDDVMVMAEDERVQANRLALLARLRMLFLRLADISRL